MAQALSVSHLSEEQRELWNRVLELWALSRARGQREIGAALHPDYVGWDMSAEAPHNRTAAVLSVSGDSPQLKDHVPHPRSVQVYDHQVGVVRYSYAATVQPYSSEPIAVNGKWTEVYLMRDGACVMIAVSGRPDARQPSPGSDAISA